MAEEQGSSSPFPPNIKRSRSVSYEDQKIKKSKLSKRYSQVTDFSLWKPMDDYMLITSFLHCYDFNKIIQDVNFSKKFSLSEVQERWTQLLYNESLANESRERMWKQKDKLFGVPFIIPWNNEEDKILRILIGDHNDSIWEKDSIKIFEDCLLKNSKVFHVNRTPQQLRKRLVYLTTLDSLKTKEEPKIPLDESIQIEIERDAMKERLSIKLLENDLQELNKTSFDDQTLALLRGETIRFYMKSNQILIGKKTKTQDETISIDLDLSSEKNCQKISRSQAILSFSEDFQFYLLNLGKNSIFVNGETVPYKTARILTDLSLIEIADVPLIFEINSQLVSKIKNLTISSNNFKNSNEKNKQES